MYITIDETNYFDVRNLSFGGDVDPTCDTLPIDELTVEVVSGSDIAYGQFMELYDDRNNLWAKFWIIRAERNGEAINIRAQSPLALLDRVELPAVMYSAYAVEDALDDIFNALTPGGAIGIDYALDAGYEGETLSGFCPAQNGRERLQWVCFALGACVQSLFTSAVQIRPIEDEELMIPLADTYWRPRPSDRDYVTAVRVTAFSYTQGTPQTTDEWVTDGTNTYIVTRQEVELSNSAAPASAPPNAITVDGVGLVHSGNVSAIASRLARYWFIQTEIDMECIDNASYGPGDRVVAYAEPEKLVTGIVQRANWTFGKQARAQLHLAAVDTVAGAKLVILYKWGDAQLNRAEYWFPVGYWYGVANPYIDMVYGDHRYVFRPTTEAVEGELPAEGAEEEAEYEIALDLHRGVLHVISVDSVTAETDATTGIVTGVIA